MAEQSFDISKYITAADIAAAVTAGIVAYMSNNAQAQDEQQPQVKQPQGAADASAADPTIRIDHGRIDINDPKLWKDGGVVNMNGNEIHVFKAPDGSTIRVNPYQLQAAGGDPMKAAMNQFAAKVQNGQVDVDKLFAAGQTVTTPSGMPVTVNAPNGVSAQDAMAQVRRGMTVDPLGIQPAPAAMNDASLKAIQSAVDSGTRGSWDSYMEAFRNIKEIAGVTNVNSGGANFLSCCSRMKVPLTDMMKYAKMVQNGETNFTPDRLWEFACRSSSSSGYAQACRKALYSVLNQSTSYNGTLVNTLSDF